MKYIRVLAPFLIITLFLLPAIWPLLAKGFFVSDDGGWMIIRLSAFHEALRGGQFPVRFLPNLNHGYGYPVLDFLYPLPFYLGEMLHLIGFSFVESIKTLFILSFLLSAYFMYLLVAAEWGMGSGLLAAVFFALAPYRLFDVYKRGSVGEAVAFIFVPLIFYFLRRFEKNHHFRNLSVASLSLAALISSHNVVAFLFFPVILAYVFFKLVTVKHQKPLVLFLLLGLGASAWFWFPALFDLQFTRAAAVSVANYRDYFLRIDNFMPLIGPIIPAVLVISAIKCIQKRSKYLLIILITAFMSLFFTTVFSNLFWQFSPLPRLIQFPWRFLSVTVFLIALCLSYLVREIKPVFLLAAVLIVELVSLFSFPQIIPTNYPDSYYATNDDTTTVKNEYMSRWVKSDPVERPGQFFAIPPEKGQMVSGSTVKLDDETQIVASQVYFPGQTALVDGKPVSSTISENGLVTFSVPPGQHELSVVFRETPWRLAADLVSLAAIIISLLLLIR